MGKVLIIMGSKSDLDHGRKIVQTLNKFAVSSVMNIASAHKAPLKVLDILEKHTTEDVVFITVAGRSNALSGFVDANTTKPVIACPPVSDKFGGADIFSSLRMPSGVCPLVVLEPEQAALAAVKILAFSDKSLQERVKKFQEQLKQQIDDDDEKVKCSD